MNAVEELRELIIEVDGQVTGRFHGCEDAAIALVVRLLDLVDGEISLVALPLGRKGSPELTATETSVGRGRSDDRAGREGRSTLL